MWDNSSAEFDGISTLPYHTVNRGNGQASRVVAWLERNVAIGDRRRKRTPAAYDATISVLHLAHDLGMAL